MRSFKHLSVMLIVALSLMFSGCYRNTHFVERDGYWWRTLNRHEKLTYSVGFVDGIKLGANMSAWKSERTDPHAAQAARDSYKEHFTKYLPDAVTNSRIVDGLDDFYLDEMNRKITISSAVWVVLKQAADDPKPEIDKLIQNLRKNNL